MAESGFECVREDAQKLWVRTPFPVSQNVWSSFAFDVFPQFNTYAGNAVNDKRQIDPNTRYLNRILAEDGMPVDEIADGQYGFYWVHGRLPHDKRANLGIDNWGMIQVPDNQTFYLDQIQRDYSKHPRMWQGLLEDIKVDHEKTLEELFAVFRGELSSPWLYSSTGTLHLRDGLTLVIAGCSNTFMPPYIPRQAKKEESVRKIYLGELPMFCYSPKDVLRAQTAIDFLRDFDNQILIKKIEHWGFKDPEMVAQFYNEMVDMHSHLFNGNCPAKVSPVTVLNDAIRKRREYIHSGGDPPKIPGAENEDSEERPGRNFTWNDEMPVCR